jgi:hypothetical protein
VSSVFDCEPALCSRLRKYAIAGRRADARLRGHDSDGDFAPPDQVVSLNISGVAEVPAPADGDAEDAPAGHATRLPSGAVQQPVREPRGPRYQTRACWEPKKCNSL